MRLRPHLPFPVNATIIAAGALLVGKSAAADVVAPATQTVVEGHTVTDYQTRVKTVKRVVHGKVVVKNERIYVRVPVVVVHTDHHTIRVPQHLLPLRSAAATVADPRVTVTVEVPGSSPEPVTVTSTVTSTDTEISVVTTTISLPLDPTPSDQQEAP
jgi:hypothetical protein